MSNLLPFVNPVTAYDPASLSALEKRLGEATRAEKTALLTLLGQEYVKTLERSRALTEAIALIRFSQGVDHERLGAFESYSDIPAPERPMASLLNGASIRWRNSYIRIPPTVCRWRPGNGGTVVFLSYKEDSFFSRGSADTNPWITYFVQTLALSLGDRFVISGAGNTAPALDSILRAVGKTPVIHGHDPGKKGISALAEIRKKLHVEYDSIAPGLLFVVVLPGGTAFRRTFTDRTPHIDFDNVEKFVHSTP